MRVGKCTNSYGKADGGTLTQLDCVRSVKVSISCARVSPAR